MSTSRKMSITVPAEMAEFISRKVKSGEYASDSEVFRDGLRLLRARDQAVERWLQDDVAQSVDAMRKRATPGMSAEALRDELAKRQRQPRSE